MSSSTDDYYEQACLYTDELAAKPYDLQRIREATALIPSDVGSILDVGCGNGWFLNSLSDDIEKRGIDGSSEALKHVRCPTIQGDVGQLPLPDKSHDLVTCYEVIEHLNCGTFPLALSELSRVARKYIMVSVPNHENLKAAARPCPQCHCRFHPARHVRSFTPDSLGGLFDGFETRTVQEIVPVAVAVHSLVLSSRFYRTLTGSEPLLPQATCPQCHYRRPDPPRSNGSVAVNGQNHSGWRRLIAKPLQLLPKVRKAHWLIALYVRGDD